MDELKNITTSTFSFPDIIANNFVYVDKTAYLHELLKDGKNQCFGSWLIAQDLPLRT